MPKEKLEAGDEYELKKQEGMRLQINIDKERIAELCKKHHIRKLSFFGSILRKDFNQNSDIDILVEQALENPGISGAQYQQGELAGYETREYLLEKWGRRCAYCDADAVPLQVEHIVPRSRGGSNRVSNLTLACRSCNEEKSSTDVREFLACDPVRLERLLANAKRPLAAAAALNATRWALWRRLVETDLPVEAGTGGRTKWNRCRFGVPKTHALDAACVGRVEQVAGWRQSVLMIKAMGRGSYQRTRVTKHGFPRGYLMRRKQVQGFQIGDLVRAVVSKGKKAGVYVGRVAIRATGSFNIQTESSTVEGISWRYCRLLYRADGYTYNQRDGASSPA